MKSKFVTTIMACIVLTVISGVIRGYMDQRWGPSTEMLAAAERVRAIPERIGDWQATSLDELSDDTVKMLRCTGNVFRTYVHRRTGKQISVVFMVGPAGPLAIHTPDVCYRSSNYREYQSRRRKPIVDANGIEHDFFVTTFQENNVGKRLLRVYYSWNHDQRWRAPGGARSAFAGVPMLYKIQVATHDVDRDEDTRGGTKEVDAAEQFLGEAMPVLERTYTDVNVVEQ